MMLRFVAAHRIFVYLLYRRWSRRIVLPVSVDIFKC
jgi:hypothetical protein